MIESDHAFDALTGLPVFSLYGKTRKPTRQMFDHLDVLLIDLVDVGTRVYTFLYTMAYCLEAAAQFGKKVIVLDRPNPIGGVLVEGNVLQTDYASFVGLLSAADAPRPDLCRAGPLSSMKSMKLVLICDHFHEWLETLNALS